MYCTSTRILSLMLENQTLFIGRTVNHVLYFGGRVAPVCTGVNSKNRVGAYLTTRNGPQRTAATLFTEEQKNIGVNRDCKPEGARE